MTLVGEIIEKIDESPDFLKTDKLNESDLILFRGYNESMTLALFVYKTAKDGKQVSGFSLNNDTSKIIRDSILSTDYKRSGYKQLDMYRLNKRRENFWQRETPNYDSLSEFIREKLNKQ